MVNGYDGSRHRGALSLALSAFVVTVIIAGLLAPYRHGNAGRVADKALANSDFGAFYCAALAARTGADPYKTDSLVRCQRDRVYGPGGVPFETKRVKPAPLPGYDFALFALLTFLPYREAGLLWTAILVVANFAAAGVLRQLTRLPFGLLVAALAVTNGAICYQFGQEQPFVTLALVASALLLREGRPQSAAAVASVTLIEPHVGLPVMLALFFWTPARLAVIAACVAFCALSVAFVGVAANVEYFARVLPVHAFAEVPVWFQYSLTSVLYSLGAADALSLRIASAQYALTMALAIAFAGPLARRIGKPALILFPAACAVLGGPFMHIQEIASAIPFAVYLAACVPGFAVAGWVAVVLLGLRWPETSNSTEAIGLVLVLGAATFALTSRPLGLRMGIGVAAFALYFALNRALAAAPYANTRALPSPAAVAAATAQYDPSLASTRWAIQLRRDGNRSERSLRRDFERLPTWLALLILFAAGIGLRRQHVPVTSSQRISSTL